MTQTKSKQTDLNDIVGKQQDSESEGSIQEVCGFDTEIQILDGVVKEGKFGKYALITVLEDIVERKVHSSSKPIIIVVSLVIGVAVLIGLAWGLYAWASSLAEDEIEGKWYDDDGDWIEFSSGDKFECTDCNFDEWRMGEDSGEVALCADDSDAQGGGCDGSWYYTFEYEVKGDVLFLAPHNPGGNIGSCTIFVKSGNSYSDTYDSESSPSWCDA